MGYFQVRYDSRVVNYDHRGFIRLATGLMVAEEGSRSRGHEFESTAIPTVPQPQPLPCGVLVPFSLYRLPMS